MYQFRPLSPFIRIHLKDCAPFFFLQKITKITDPIKLKPEIQTTSMKQYKVTLRLEKTK